MQPRRGYSKLLWRKPGLIENRDEFGRYFLPHSVKTIQCLKQLQSEDAAAFGLNNQKQVSERRALPGPPNSTGCQEERNFSGPGIRGQTFEFVDGGMVDAGVQSERLGQR